MARDKLISIQVLRAVAALSVLIGHAQTNAEQMSETFTRTAFPWGAGVDIFFVISGFIMVVSSEKLYGAAGGFREFLTRRIVRVVPLYWLYTTLAIAALFVVPGELNKMRWDTASAVGSYLFYPVRRWDGAISPILSLGWTLNYEMFFYVLFSATLFLSRAKSILLLVSMLAVLAIIGAQVEFKSAPPEFWTNPIIIEFAFGVLIGYAYLSFRWLPSTLMLIVGLGLAAAGQFVLDEVIAAPRAIAWGVPAALLVASAIWGAGERLSGLLKPLADWLGESSYSLYLSHPFAVGGVGILWPFAPGQADWAFVATSVIVALIGGVISHRLVEQPMLAFLRRRVEPRRSGDVAAEPL
ncbi:acyltransferase family protein [Caulobacter sp. NIBR2454]|uniref:acyltransferase family protein n=1 Tax=Caulobacter sp. NIBR2454 TaxID=3015996 RepID=UPI0022B7466D|nr:acyltransferase [Caulobacter sp. NIBR2454]